MKLHLSDDLSLPLDAVTETFGLLAARGAGKSNTAAVMAEEMFAAKLPFVVIDPARAWWGLRLSRDGKSAGLPIPIFGGRKGDIPLDRSSGTLMADLVVDQRVTCVLDISEFPSESARTQFLTDFAKRLFDRNEQPLHLFLEEADEYIPQVPMGDEKVMLRAWSNIVRRGRNRGIGVTLITQRSAAINKNVLTQVQTLIPMRTTGPQDIDAIERWVKYHHQSGQILESLAGLDDGEGWVWSPHFLKKTVRTKFRLRNTYDSGRTPKVTDKAKPPATLADIDLGALRERMTVTIERAKKEDPRLLRQRISELEKELRNKLPIATVFKPVEKIVEVPVLTDKQIAALESHVTRLEKSVEYLDKQRDALAQSQQIVVSEVGMLADAIKDAKKGFRMVVDKPSSAGGTKPATRVIFQGTHGDIERPVPSESGEPSLKAGARRMLAVLGAHHPTPLTRQQLGVQSVVSHTGGTFTGYVSVLRQAGLVETPPGQVQLTDDGMAEANRDGRNPIAPTLQHLLSEWRKAPRMKAGAVRMLDCLIEAHPKFVQRDDLGGLSRTAGGTFTGYLSVLRTNGLVEEDRGKVKATDALFMGE
jgi:hypothetical protein